MVETPLSDKHCFDFNIPQQKRSFEYEVFLSLFNMQQGVWEVGDERGIKQVLFSYCCILPQAELQIIVGHWTKKDSLVVHESCMWHKSSSLLYKLPNCPDKIEFWAFLCFSLYFSPFSSKKILFINFSIIIWLLWQLMQFFNGSKGNFDSLYSM